MHEWEEKNHMAAREVKSTDCKSVTKYLMLIKKYEQLHEFQSITVNTLKRWLGL